MQSRRSFFARAAMLLAALTSGLANLTRLRAAEPAPIGSGLASLTFKQQLEKGLKARRPSDFAFIETVVANVDSGALSQKMVTETFGYARIKSSTYPFIYFQFAIRKRAAKLGVTL
jgi:hypothetical protein